MTRSGLAERREEPRRARRENPGEAGSEVDETTLSPRALSDLSALRLSRARPTALSRSLARRRARADRVSESTRKVRALYPPSLRASRGCRAVSSYADFPC